MPMGQTQDLNYWIEVLCWYDILTDQGGIQLFIEQSFVLDESHTLGKATGRDGLL